MLKLALSLLFAFSMGITASAADREPPLMTVEDAARQFRVATYDHFRMDREQFEARRAAGETLLAAWNRAKQPAEHRQMVVNWYLEAAVLTQQNPVAVLPRVPELPLTSTVSRRSLDDSPALGTPTGRPAYLDPEAIQTLEEVSGRKSSAEQGDDATGPNSTVSQILEGLKRVVLGNE